MKERRLLPPRVRHRFERRLRACNMLLGLGAIAPPRGDASFGIPQTKLPHGLAIRRNPRFPSKSPASIHTRAASFAISPWWQKALPGSSFSRLTQ
jgi:hypothetical protein